MLQKGKFLLLAFVLLLSIWLRLHNYSAYPQRGSTSDEYTYAFLGVSLLTKGIPISWSSFGDYPLVTPLIIDKIYFPIVQPYFDHPPLHGLMVGGWALAFGQNTFEKITLNIIRIEPIILALISTVLIFLLADKLFGTKTAFWSCLIFSTAPLFIMNTRVVFAENLLTVFFLLSLYLYVLFHKRVNSKRAFLLGAIAGLALLTKIAGIALFPILFYVFLVGGVKRKQILFLTAGFLLGALCLLGYAAYYNWDLFWAVQKSQGLRTIGPETIFYLITTPIIVNKIVFDGWYLAGFISLFATFLDFKKYKYIIIPPFVYLVLMVFTLTREGQSGWYMIPLFPFMAIAIAALLNDGIKQMNFYPILFVLLIGMSHIKTIYKEMLGLDQIRFRIASGSLLLPPVIFQLLNKKHFFSMTINALFYIFILGNIILTYNYVHPS